LKKRIILLTGAPGVGKTSVLLRVIDCLRSRGYSVGGMVSQDVRVGNSRVGFEVLDIGTGRKGWLARVAQKEGPQVGRYRVNIGDLDNIGATAIADAVANSAVVAIDEIGPMELCSQKFKDVVGKAVESSKLVLCVVHWKAADNLASEIRGRDDAEIIVVSIENRGRIDTYVCEKAVGFLSESP